MAWIGNSDLEIGVGQSRRRHSYRGNIGGGQDLPKAICVVTGGTRNGRTGPDFEKDGSGKIDLRDGDIDSLLTVAVTRYAHCSSYGCSRAGHLLIFAVGYVDNPSKNEGNSTPNRRMQSAICGRTSAVCLKRGYATKLALHGRTGKDVVNFPNKKI